MMTIAIGDTYGMFEKNMGLYISSHLDGSSYYIELIDGNMNPYQSVVFSDIEQIKQVAGFLNEQIKIIEGEQSHRCPFCKETHYVNKDTHEIKCPGPIG